MLFDDICNNQRFQIPETFFMCVCVCEKYFLDLDHIIQGFETMSPEHTCIQNFQF